MTIELYLQTTHPPALPPATWQEIFSQWQKLLLEQYSLPHAEQDWELTLRLTDDQEMQALNQQYRQQDRPTDVLAFPAPPLIPEEPIYLGDIVISLETAQRQAEAQAWHTTTEIIWLASHGFLHLLGWDHPDQASLETMWDIQETMLTAIAPCVREHTENQSNMPI